MILEHAPRAKPLMCVGLKDTMATHETSIVIYTEQYKQSKQSQLGKG